MSFAFVGHLPSSKSILNRLLIAQSYAPTLQIHGDSRCEDVEYMKSCLATFDRKAASTAGVHELEVGAGGTTLRFLALRAARAGGEFVLRGTRRLFERPQDELVKILRQLSVEAELGADFMRIKGSGWRLQGDTLLVPFARSSQFASAVLMNAWDLPFDLFVSLGGQKVSEGYWRMSVRMAHDLGMKIDFWDGDFRVPRGQKITAADFKAETDLSSTFAVAAVAAVSGTATFTDFPAQSFQPDAEFVRILAAMGVPLSISGGTLRIERAPRLNGVAVNLKSSPDLFPVLSALCALAEGDSNLYGAPQLAYKESNRGEKMAQIIRAIGRECEVTAEGLVIRGPVVKPSPSKKLRIDCDHDHRVAFAAAVYRAAGFDVDIGNPEVVNKSFPEFWSILG